MWSVNSYSSASNKGANNRTYEFIHSTPDVHRCPKGIPACWSFPLWWRLCKCRNLTRVMVDRNPTRLYPVFDGSSEVFVGCVHVHTCGGGGMHPIVNSCILHCGIADAAKLLLRPFLFSRKYIIHSPQFLFLQHRVLTIMFIIFLNLVPTGRKLLLGQVVLHTEL
ncbi:hypothetical protein BU24DRAFT_219247 [Aaosphaeria arxii CBS 175.79]|uniref:Uncharacterized protein n=1 Tax=Aaosphaeria arxii CBS 175.79 TaxID=1450172 RepID=A0A6A5XP97_9PLEO|nr:uncharacterized protein BU24DRAFT_219247 [Aaosphaeria arxii CBS 175.79]KAF2014667.1 hypothetical protein BU24DRAFT_219247 [Aaosphaeria arxii CBS 175.79]